MPFTAIQFTCKALARFSPFQLPAGPKADTEPPGQEGREGRGDPPSLHTPSPPAREGGHWAVALTTERVWLSLGMWGGRLQQVDLEWPRQGHPLQQLSRPP